MKNDNGRESSQIRAKEKKKNLKFKKKSNSVEMKEALLVHINRVQRAIANDQFWKNKKNLEFFF